MFEYVSYLTCAVNRIYLIRLQKISRVMMVCSEGPIFMDKFDAETRGNRMYN